MALFVNNYTNLGPTPVSVNPAFPKPMTQVLIVASPNTGNDQVIVTVSGQNISIGEGTLLKLEQPGPFQLSGTSGLDSAYVVCMQSDNYQLTGKLVEVEATGMGGGGGTTYTADGVTLQLTGTTFSIKNNGVGSAQLANGAVGPTQLNSSVAGNGLTGGSGVALDINVDNTTVEVNADTLRVKALGINTPQLANYAVGTQQIDIAAVQGPQLGLGAQRNPVVGQYLALDATNQPNPLEGISIEVTDPMGTFTWTGVANGAGPLDFAIGGTLSDTLTNLCVSFNTAMGTSRNQARAVHNGTYVLFSPEYVIFPPTSGLECKVDLLGSSLTNFTPSVPSQYNQPSARVRSTFLLPVTPTAADVARGANGLIYVKPTFMGMGTDSAWILAKRGTAALQVDCQVTFDSTLGCWVIENIGGPLDWQAGDELLLVGFYDAT